MNQFNLKARMLLAGSLLFSLYIGIAALLYNSGISLGIIGVISIGYIGIQFWLSQKLILQGMSTTKLEDDELVWLQTFVRTQSEEMGIAEPDFRIAEMGMANAFAMGRRGKSTVVVSTELIELLSQDEVKAVVAHELAHIKNRDSIIMLLGQGVATLVGLAVFFISIANEDIGYITGWILSSIAQFLVTIIVLVVSRQREFVADETAANAIGTGQRLASALKTIDNSVKNSNTNAIDSSASAMCISRPGKGFLSSLLSTHPPMEKRIERLQ